MTQKAADIIVPELVLSACSVEEHCRALREIARIPFWWYQGTSKVFGNFSLPFQDSEGNWWYQVKPGLCWAVDCFTPIVPDRARPGFTKTFLGYQHVVSNDAEANSALVINSIMDLSAYDQSAINSKRRNAIRKGLKCCSLSVETDPDRETLDGCREAWEELTERTGWKGKVKQDWFDVTWKFLALCPGVSIIVGRDAESGRVAGFLVTKIIGETAYVDTIASCSGMLHMNVNDAVMYAFLMNAKNLPGVTRAHYAIKSKVTRLEKFKTSLGFVPDPFPARLRLRPIVGWALRRFRRSDGVFRRR